MTTTLFILTLLAAVPGLVYPIVYATTARWWDTVIGRAHMVLSGALGAIMFLVLISLLFGELPGRTALRIGTWSVLAVGLWAELITYWITLRRIRKGKKK